MDKLSVPLFSGITDSEWKYLENNNFFRKLSFRKNEYVFHMGDIVTEIGIVTKGSVTIENIDLWGNKAVLSHISRGQVFAETYCFCREPMQVNVTACENTDILFLDMKNLRENSNAAAYGQHDDTALSLRNKLLNNMLEISMHKNLTLSNRIFCTAPKTIRSRLLIFLSNESRKSGSRNFTIPYDRQQLADYLNVERTALSKELGKMQKDGLIIFEKNHFTVLSQLSEL